MGWSSGSSSWKISPSRMSILLPLTRHWATSPKSTNYHKVLNARLGTECREMHRSGGKRFEELIRLSLLCVLHTALRYYKDT